MSQANPTAAAQLTPFPYAAADYEEVPCNLCGSGEARIVALRDRNGLRVRSVMCTTCGLIYLSPRMTADWYGRYYAVEYRRQMSAFKGGAAHPSLEKIYQAQLKRGAWLADYLKRHGVPAPKAVLDIGSSTGGLLRALADTFGCRVLGVEPSPEETAFAEDHGVPTRLGLFEDFRPAADERFDLILCTQSYNHLLNPRQVTEKLRECLTPEGVFFLECQDFFHVCLRRGVIHEAVQIDHTYMFVPQTMQAMLEVSGLAVMPGTLLCDRWQPTADLKRQQEAGVPSLHVRMLARRAAPAGRPSSSFAEVFAELQQLPNSPVRAAVRRGWQKLRRGLRPYARAVWPRRGKARKAAKAAR